MVGRPGRQLAARLLALSWGAGVHCRKLSAPILSAVCHFRLFARRFDYCRPMAFLVDVWCHYHFVLSDYFQSHSQCYIGSSHSYSAICHVRGLVWRQFGRCRSSIDRSRSSIDRTIVFGAPTSRLPIYCDFNVFSDHRGPGEAKSVRISYRSCALSSMDFTPTVFHLGRLVYYCHCDDNDSNGAVVRFRRFVAQSTAGTNLFLASIFIKPETDTHDCCPFNILRPVL